MLTTVLIFNIVCQHRFSRWSPRLARSKGCVQETVMPTTQQFHRISSPRVGGGLSDHRIRPASGLALVGLFLGVAGCSDAAATGGDAGPSADTASVTDTGAMPTADTGAPQACAASTVRCTDQSVALLRLFEPAAPAALTEEGTPGAFRTLIDARAGGSMATQSYVYVRFTDAGLEQLPIGDEAAFRSLDWDLAVRRFVIRINSGVGGPGCVQAARTAPGTTFDALTTLPTGLSWRTEAYFTDSCELVSDGSGIGAPGTALSSFWAYQSCVQMTGNVFAVALRNGRHVKLQVLSYYDPEPQAACDRTGMVPAPNNAGMIRLRWSFLD